ncbi:MAG: hypothetical protein OXC72_01355, partial [Roseovarius sp.]|nr:hypothetical protein [Roseovarius sp.]
MENWLFAYEMQAVERQIQGSEAGFRDFSRSSLDFRQFGPEFGQIRRIPDRLHRRPVSRRPKKRWKGDHGMWRRNWSIARARTPNM